MNTFLKNLTERWIFLRSLSVNHWRYLLKNLSRLELNLILTWLAIAFAAAAFLTGYDYWALRSASPDQGGAYSEGIVGEPRYINPLLAVANEADRDLATLIFAGLVKHDESGNIIPDLAESYLVKDNGKTYEFTLKENLAWPDGQPLTSDDVVFTLNLIKDPKYQIPLRNTWQGVKIDKIDERNVRMSLPVPYEAFLENVSVGILPKHLWSNIQPQNFLLTQLNLKPLGLGPYKIKKIIKNAAGSIKSIELTPNEAYPQPARIERLTLRFYENQNSLLGAYKKREIQGFSLVSAQEKEELKTNSAKLKFYNIKLPRYYAVFFNLGQSKILQDLAVRQALAYATDRSRIVKDVLKNEAEIQNGPFPPNLLNIAPPQQTYQFDLDKARTILEKNGWKISKETNLREKKLAGEKKPRPLEVVLTTIDWPELTQVASVLKEDWEKIGAKVNLDIVPVNAVQTQTLRPRAYEILLFGEVLSLNPDPFSFWHSTQKKDPGINLSLYSNKKVDGLLESARQSFNTETKIKKYEEFQKIIIQDLPAIFLYNPNYIYAVSERIKGLEIKAVNIPSQRFENINKWYIETKRIKP